MLAYIARWFDSIHCLLRRLVSCLSCLPTFLCCIIQSCRIFNAQSNAFSRSNLVVFPSPRTFLPRPFLELDRFRFVWWIGQDRIAFGVHAYMHGIWIGLDWMGLSAIHACMARRIVKGKGERWWWQHPCVRGCNYLTLGPDGMGWVRQIKSNEQRK
jgi:hypothetical protein